MGACVTHTSGNSEPNESFRIIRQGNLTFHISESSSTGEGLKKTSSWYTDLTESELSKKIKEFWDTRIDGNPRVWSILNSVCLENSQKKCKELLRQAGLYTINGTISQVQDDRGHRYDLPVFVISKPLKYGQLKEEKKIDIEQDSEFHILIRMAGKQDWKTLVRGSMMTKDLKQEIKNSLNIQKDVRLFFSGREMKDSSCLASLGLQEGFVLIVF